MKKLMLSMTAAALMAPLFAPIVMAQVHQPTQPKYAAPVQAAFSDPRNVPADLARIDAAMNSTSSFWGRFAQYASDGSFAQGQVYIRRPGRLRFEYDAPNPLLIVSDGVTLTQQDLSLIHI